MPADLKPYVDALPTPPVLDLRHRGPQPRETIELTALKHAISSQLPAGAPAWGYGGSVPGPTIVVDQAQTPRITWLNHIPAGEKLPYRAAVCADPTGTPPANEPGAPPGVAVVDGRIAGLSASVVTHLHGGLTHPDSDGWTENVAAHGRMQRCTYGRNGLPADVKQRAALLWYHDHAIGVTRLNVYAGLYGFYLVRDPAEAALIADGVLPGEADELPLLIQDRNLDLDEHGEFTGAILHKTETSTAELFAPYTLVNGVLWPVKEVPARPTRVRILNGSNSRTYSLNLIGANLDASGDFAGYDGTADHTDDLIWQVGGDGGLLGLPVRPGRVGVVPDEPTATPPSPVPDPADHPDNPGDRFSRGIVLAPAERVDLVIDFSGQAGRAFALVNTAFAPYHGSTANFPYRYDPSGIMVQEPVDNDPSKKRLGRAVPGTPAENFRLPHPDVLLFKVAADPGHAPPARPLSATTALDPSYRRIVHDPSVPPSPAERPLPAGHRHRWVALAESPPGNLMFRELAPFTADPDIAAASQPLIAIKAMNGVTTWYKTAAKGFYDPVGFFVDAGSAEVWNLLNLTGDSHPVHVHLVQFQVMHRQRVDASGYVAESGSTDPAKPIRPVEVPGEPEPPERGDKDTVAVHPGEVVSIAAFFDGHMGRYMYHCHILEHEDHDMMRPFVVVDPSASKLMDLGEMRM